MSLKNPKYGINTILALAILLIVIPVLAQSIDSSSRKNMPLLYPNPASDYLKVDLEANIKSVDIYSLVGQKLSSHDVMDNNKIFVGELPRGIYLARLFDMDGKQIKTIRLQKN